VERIVIKKEIYVIGFMQAKGGYNDMSKSLVKLVSYHLVVAMLVIGVVPRVEAGFSPSDAIALSQADRVGDLATIQKILESKKIGKRLENLGFSQSEIQSRLSRLNDDQLHKLALRLDEIRVGSGGFEVLVIILLIAILAGVWFYVQGNKIVIQSR
jgi:hypothetical protein